MITKSSIKELRTKSKRWNKQRFSSDEESATSSWSGNFGQELIETKTELQEEFQGARIEIHDFDIYW